MTLWNETAKLVMVTTSRDGCGAEVSSEEETEVFANATSIGMQSWAAARSVGLHADASLRIRAADYAGQQECELRGVRYEIERAKVAGEFCDLTLKRRLSCG